MHLLRVATNSLFRREKRMIDCTCKTCSDYNDRIINRPYRSVSGRMVHPRTNCSPNPLYHSGNYKPVFCEKADLWYSKTKVWIGRRNKPDERKRIEIMGVCNIQCKNPRNLKKHRKKIPHYRRNKKPTFLERLLGRKEFSRRQDD